MGKIITGRELINIFKGCCSGQAQSFTDAAYIDGIQESMGLSNVENSGRCPAFNGNIDTTFDPTRFWDQMYGGDTGYEFYGDYQLDWTSGYLGLVDTQLVDSTYVPNFQSQMLCTNLKYNGDFNFGVYTDGDYYGQFDITVYIKFGGTMYTVARYRTSLSSGDNESLGSYDISDIVFAGSSNIPNNSSTYTYEVKVGWETYSEGDNIVYNINGLGCDVYGESGLLSGGIIGYSASEGGGGSFTYKGQATFADITSISGVEIIGEWENAGGGSTTPDKYTTIRITNMFINTNSRSYPVYISGATSASTIEQPQGYVYLYSDNLRQSTTQVYLVPEDLANGEIGVQLPAQYIGNTSGNYLLPLSLVRSSFHYKLYIPITILPDGTVNLRGSECYLDLASVSYNTNVGLRQVWNNDLKQVTFRPLTSSGEPYKSIYGGSNVYFSPLLSTIHVYPSSNNVHVRVEYNTSTSSTSTSTVRVASNIGNTTVNIIPTVFGRRGLWDLVQCIGKHKDYFILYFEGAVA